jgi:hypothetical protein
MKTAVRGCAGRALGGASAGLSLLLLAGGVALAGNGGSSLAVVAPQAPGVADAACAPGSPLVAGGFEAPGFDAESSAVARTSSKPLPEGGVSTHAFNFGEASGKILSFAYCSSSMGELSVDRNRAYVSPGGAEIVRARCPRGSAAVGGGFATPGFSGDGPRIIPLTSKRVGERGWKVEGLNLGGDGGGDQGSGGEAPPGEGAPAPGGPDPGSDPRGGDQGGDPAGGGPRPGTLVAYAYCATEAPELVKASSTAAVPVTEIVTLDVPCPGGGRAVAGGFDGHLRLTAEPSASGAVTSRRIAGGWHTVALNISDVASSRVTAYAYCRRASS